MFAMEITGSRIAKKNFTDNVIADDVCLPGIVNNIAISLFSFGKFADSQRL